MKDLKRAAYTPYQALDAPAGTVRFPDTEVDVVSAHLEGTDDLRRTVHRRAEIIFTTVVKGAFAPPSKPRALSS